LYYNVIEAHIYYISHPHELNVSSNGICNNCIKDYEELLTAAIYTYIFNRILANDNYVHLMRQLVCIDPIMGQQLETKLRLTKEIKCSYWLNNEYYYKKIFIIESTDV
jgi:hypothetical protein